MQSTKIRVTKLAILATTLCFPIINTAKATNGWEEDLKLVTASSTSQTSSSVSLSISPGTVQTDLNAANAATNPDEAGKVLSQTATITVGNTDGYTVYVSGNTNLTGRNDTNHKIPSIASSKTLGSMSNEWGYYGVLGDTEASWNPSTSFKAMTSSQQTVATGSATSSSVTKKLTLFYGARVNDSVTEDFYGNTVTLSVVAQPRTVTTAITTMQAFDKTACGKLNTHETLQLTDTRDNKKYWVTKMLDGNCWMSQNLDLDLSTSKALTSASSDVTSSWTPPRATTTSVTTGSTSYTETYSWDLGQYVINAPTGTTSCGNNATGLSGCSMFTAVGDRTASTDPNFYRKSTYTGADGTTNCTKTANTSISTTTSGVCAQYDAHYTVGNYYQWNAATAGTGGTIYNYATAAGSICPKGWKLPGSAIDANTITKGTYAYLLQQYGLATAWNSGSLTGTSGVNGNTYDIALNPLFLVRAGGVYSDYTTASFRNAGSTGYYRSSRAYSSASHAYLLTLGTSVSPSNIDGRYRGYPLRCLIPMS